MLIPFDVPTEASVRHSIDRLLRDQGYPCVAALRSLASDECRVGVYEGFGSGRAARQLAQDLYRFIGEQKETQSPFLSFWAAFPDPIKGGEPEIDEAQFEEKLWHELSCLAEAAPFRSQWDARFSPDPQDPRFCFSFAGSACFVVGLHPRASRKSRCFPYPALVFNVYAQFDRLIQEGKHERPFKRLAASA